MVSSHRRLTHRRAREILSGVQRDVGPGEVRFYSFYSPSLQGGLHQVEVKQSISAPPAKTSEDRKRREDAIPAESQYFYVVASKFSLPVGCIDSVFPAPGTSAEVRVLPHVTFKDPHLPWERKAQYNRKDDSDNDDDAKKTLRRMTPWVALLVFTVEELTLPPDTLNTALAAMPAEVERKQSETLSVRMRAIDTVQLNNNTVVTNTIGFDAEGDAREENDAVDVVFLPQRVFNSLFIDSEAPNALNTARYKYLAHVRQIATDGMAVADVDPGSHEALLSIVLSHRTPFIGSPVPTTTVVHLVSLDMQPGLTLPFRANTSHIAMLSLHSWTYTCLPSDKDISAAARLKQLGSNLNILKPQMPDAPDPKKPTDIQDLVEKRQKDGYTLVRHRTVTGEETAVMLRGPLTPTFVKHPLRSDFAMQSNFGSDLQILDPDLSLMDITYASAWQLGRTLGMGDEAFAAALTRLRNAIHTQALVNAKRDVHAAMGMYRSRGETAHQMIGLVRGLNDLNKSLCQRSSLNTVMAIDRWNNDNGMTEEVATNGIVDLSRHSPHISTRIGAHADAAAASFALAMDGTLYNEHNVPSNTDSAHVFSWVIDKVHLADVPVQYFLPDPSFLPEETLRLFFIDENWTDALIDGALSLANHWSAEPAADEDRAAIKQAINTRLNTPDPKLGHMQMPKYGFLLRSQLLVQFPDLTVEVRYSTTHNSRTGDKGDPIPAPAPILVQKRIAADCMYCLFDCTPPELKGITFTLPPHQQCFTVGESLVSDSLVVGFRKIYTDSNGVTRDDRRRPLGEETYRPTDASPTFDWNSRTLQVKQFAQLQFDKLRTELGDKFADTKSTSALLALQLNDPIYQLDLGDLTKAAPSGSNGLFQLSMPGREHREAPALAPLSERPTPPARSLARPRPPSPRLEAALVADQSREPSMPEVLWELAPPDDGANRPIFKLVVHPVRKREFVPSNSPLPMDLIFSIRQTKRPQSWEPLRRMILEVPYGKMPKDANGGEDDPVATLLAEDADPPAPTMLSNLRFNILKKYRADKNGRDKYLVLEVVPRSSKGVLVSQIIDASFLLSRAKITKYEGSEPKTPYVSLKYDYGNFGDKKWDDGVRVLLKPDPKQTMVAY